MPVNEKNSMNGSPPPPPPPPPETPPLPRRRRRIAAHELSIPFVTSSPPPPPPPPTTPPPPVRRRIAAHELRDTPMAQALCKLTKYVDWPESEPWRIDRTIKTNAQLRTRSFRTKLAEKLFEMYVRDDDVLVIPQVIGFDTSDDESDDLKLLFVAASRAKNIRTVYALGSCRHVTPDHTYRHAYTFAALNDTLYVFDPNGSKLSPWRKRIIAYLRRRAKNHGVRLNVYNVPYFNATINVGHVEHLSKITRVPFSDVDASYQESFCATISIWMLFDLLCMNRRLLNITQSITEYREDYMKLHFERFVEALKGTDDHNFNMALYARVIARAAYDIVDPKRTPRKILKLYSEDVSEYK